MLLDLMLLSMLLVCYVCWTVKCFTREIAGIRKTEILGYKTE